MSPVALVVLATKAAKVGDLKANGSRNPVKFAIGHSAVIAKYSDRKSY
jgi:hypothetical protein